MREVPETTSLVGGFQAAFADDNLPELAGEKLPVPVQKLGPTSGFIERLWRTLKYEDIYLNDYQTMVVMKAGVTRYMQFYNEERFHASHNYLTPDEVYRSKFQPEVNELCSVA